MTGWSIKHYPTIFSFGVKLLLLAGVMGVLSFVGVLDSPSQPAPSDALSVQQADASTGGSPQSPPVRVADVGRVNINRSSVEDLLHLPGVGPVLAERIIQYRQEHGKFVSIRDIQSIKGIGEKRFAQLEPYIDVELKSPSLGE
ncbi:MAG: helix-hairpin-helix domain-containing protein [Nitrospira sp. SB0677_bin_15]|nr:helix-hairpin-helix domain-containing protein [Nitrospira sp. SB0667_bin_9]MYD31898.1 helix-hairpin-helix domain-containing protein [Nitrospira sp. SB0661_bin_20]MYG39329.1 helix-hairpin-helix domain-containing protein [Nitrospira sp. SB0677_bin_15]MYH02277.1 helix-hairpin-helix domain-containing protein [Nitrospira sp. SB0675_bin_23]MYJ23241.1 helix-hairpin-helix domain-containing protein [Nitrospira sp. SB0673_bin_12]